MISTVDLKNVVKARLKDAQILYRARRYDGAVYLCGYAIELQLKYRICKTLKWSEFPLSNNEFKNYHSFKTHNLDILLHLCPKEDRIKKYFLADWSIVAKWDPEMRYNIMGVIVRLRYVV